MPELQSPLIGQPPLVYEPQGGKDELLGALPHDQVQHDRNGDKRTSQQQRQINESHFSVLDQPRSILAGLMPDAAYWSKVESPKGGTMFHREPTMSPRI